MSRKNRQSNSAMQLALEALGFKEKTLDVKYGKSKKKKWWNKTKPKSKNNKNVTHKKIAPPVSTKFSHTYSKTIKHEVAGRKNKKPQTKPILEDKYSLANPEKFPLIKFNDASCFNRELLIVKDYDELKINFTESHRTQIYDGDSGEADIVIGLDFGTANTKVVLMEQGSKNSWAVPFTRNKENPYLLPSRVFLSDGKYSLLGDENQAVDNLKLPFLQAEYDHDKRCHMAAFLTLVIRQSREWFLQNSASAFNGFEFEWHFHMGLPASNYDDKNLVQVFRDSLLCAAITSLGESKAITRLDVEKTINTTENFYKDNSIEIKVDPDYVNVFPELAAQLHGYISSDKWDKNRPKFMLADIGGGTVDASIVNVAISDMGVPKYNILKSEVDSLGVVILHNYRMAWIKRSIEAIENYSSKLLMEFRSINVSHDNTLPMPAKVDNYLDKVEWPENFDFDILFYHLYSNLLWTKIIHPVRKSVDTERSQWRSLQFVLCGGGALHPLYGEFINKINANTLFHVNLDRVAIDKPDNLISPEAKNSDYHRLSVAYGLSHLELGKVIPESQLIQYSEDLNPKKNKPVFIDKDMM